MRKQFDIKYRSQIESGEYKVETRDGRIAKIIYWEAHHCMPIIILIQSDVDNGTEIPLQLYKNGKFYPKGDSNFDLFIITPEEEMTEWEKAICRVLRDAQFIPRDKDGIANIHDIDEFIKNRSEELLVIAKEECKKQIENDYREIIYGAYKKGMDEALKDLEETGKVHCKSYDKGYEDGMKEALKDLPRWGDIRNFQYAWKSQEETFYDRDLGQLFHKGKKLFISDLEKLPGFKKD